MNDLIVFSGAGFGGMARHAVNVTVMRLLDAGSFLFGTLAIDLIGSCLMSIVFKYFALRSGLSQHPRLFLTTGILGGFTPFSAFSLVAALLIERGQTVKQRRAEPVFQVANPAADRGLLYAQRYARFAEAPMLESHHKIAQMSKTHSHLGSPRFASTVPTINRSRPPVMPMSMRHLGSPAVVLEYR